MPQGNPFDPASSGPASGQRDRSTSQRAFAAGTSTNAALTTALSGANNDLTFTAGASGPEGTAISVRYVDPGTASQPRTVAVVGQDITVNLGSTAPQAATLTTNLTGPNNDLTYTAVTPGTGGNAISVEYVDPGSPAQALAAGVTGDAISVDLGTSDGDAAKLTTSLTGTNNDLVYTADTPGTGGNAITVEYVDPGSDGATIGVTVVGDAISVDLGTDDGDAAELTTALAGANNDLTYTAADGGSGGNAITVEYVVAGNDTPLSIGVTGNAITVNVATDSGGAPTSTASDVASAVAGDTGAAGLVDVADAPSNDGTGVVDALAAANLTGGGANYALSTAAAVSAAITADSGAAALVNVANAPSNSGAGAVTALPAANLTGGGANYTFSTASQVRTAVLADSGAAALVSIVNKVGNTGAGAVTALAPTNLSGGAAYLLPTASEVASSVNGEPAAHALVDAQNAPGNDGSGRVTALSKTNLSGGSTGRGVAWRSGRPAQGSTHPFG